MRVWHIFFIAFSFTLLAQSVIWHFDTLTDEGVWVERVQQTAVDLRDGTFDQKDYSGHPGMAVLLPAAVLQMTGLSEIASLKTIMALWISAAVAGVAVVAYGLFPTLPAWVGAAGMMALHPVFVQTSPTNAVVGALLTLVLWIVMWAEKNRSLPYLWAAVLGASVGAGLATHFSLTILMSVPALIFLGWRLGRKPILISVASAAVVWLLLDPLLWQQPRIHMAYMLQRIELHTTELGVATMTPFDLPLFAPLALISWLVAAGVVLSGMANTLPRAALVFAVGLSLLATIIFLRAQSQSIRYFFPLILFWESVLPVWLLQLAVRSRQPVAISALVVAGLLAVQTYLTAAALL